MRNSLYATSLDPGHTMERWREKAREMFPELASRFEPALKDVDTPYTLWFELREAFEEAYDKTPPDESLIRRIYQYSGWCCDQVRCNRADDDLLTCVSVSFYEHIPRHAKARDDMPRWWQREDLDVGPGERHAFEHYLDAEQFAELKRFLENERDRYDPDLW